MNSLAVTWEAAYDDGTVLAERSGARYAQIERDRLKSFRLVSPGEILVDLPVGDGRTGYNLVYRRRTIFGGGNKVVWYLAGWVPMGPVVAIQPETETVKKSVTFEQSGPLRGVEPTPEERWLPSHKTDFRLKTSKVTLPSGYVLKT